MKELYTKLKDQHVVLLRQEADVRKQQSSLAEQCEHANKMKKELEKRLEEAIEEKTKIEANLQSKTAEYQSLKSENEKNQASQIAITQVVFFFKAFEQNLMNNFFLIFRQIKISSNYKEINYKNRSLNWKKQTKK